MAAEKNNPPSLWSSLRSDRWLLAGGVAFIVLVALYLSLEAEQRVWLTTVGGPITFLLLATLASWRAGAATRRVPEKSFWRLLAGSLLLWMLGVLTYALTGATSLVGDLLGDVCYAGYFTLLIVAVETRPHRRSRVARLETRLMAPAAGFFVGGWLAYFTIVKVAAGLGGEESSLPSLMLFSLLDAYLAGRLLQLAAHTSGGWRPIYSLLGAGAGGFLLSDLSQVARYLLAFSWPWSAPSSALHVVPFLVMVAAARVAVHGLRGPGAGSAYTEAARAGPISRPLPTVLWALSFPVLHVLMAGAGWLSPRGEGPREVVVIILVATLGAYALLQRHLLVRRSLELWRERRKISEELRESEQDLLLMVHRDHQRAELERHELTYKKAFQASPDGLLLIDWRTRRVLDVNRSGVELLGGAREELLDRPASELGLWRSDENLRALLAGVDEKGSLRSPDIDIDIETDVEGELGVELSFEKIETYRGRLLLVVLRRLLGGGEGREWLEALDGAGVRVESADGEVLLAGEPAVDAADFDAWDVDERDVYSGKEGRLVLTSGAPP